RIVELLWDGFMAAVGLILRADPELRDIAALSLGVSGTATALAALSGIPLGVALHLKRFRGRRMLGLLVNAGMGLPPVVVGLVVTLLLWRTGRLAHCACSIRRRRWCWRSCWWPCPSSRASPARPWICST